MAEPVIVDVRTPYELLIRGRPAGGIAAHVEWRHTVTMDGVVLKDEVEPAVAISPEAMEGTPFQELIGHATVVAIQDNEAKTLALAEALDKIEGLERDLAARVAALVEAEAALAALTKDPAGLA